jgi:hypothetical protein
VVLSMTTSPTRISSVYNIVQLLHPALYDEVHVNVPKVYGRTGAGYEVPLELTFHEKIKVFVIEKDLGPITKLVPTIERLQKRHESFVCITLDDDV